MLALPTSEPCSENLKCESTFANYKVLRKFTVFLLEGPATSLPGEPLTDLPRPHPSRALLRLCLEKHNLWRHRYRPGSRGHCCVSITNTQASGFSPFHMLNFIGVPCVESLLEETQQLQSSAPYRLGLNVISAWTFWGLLWGPILQSFNMRNSPGRGSFGNSSRLRSTASRIDHQGGPFSQNGP